MLTLTPHKILTMLGFQIPEEGITISPTDSYLTSELLRLVGKTIDINKVPDEDFQNVLRAIRHLRSGKGYDENLKEPTLQQLQEFRALMQALLKETFKYQS